MARPTGVRLFLCLCRGARGRRTERNGGPKAPARRLGGEANRTQAGLYSCDLKERCRTAPGASASLRMFAQVCL